jgi:hypothetical protein
MSCSPFQSKKRRNTFVAATSLYKSPCLFAPIGLSDVKHFYDNITVQNLFTSVPVMNSCVALDRSVQSADHNIILNCLLFKVKKKYVFLVQLITSYTSSLHVCFSKLCTITCDVPLRKVIYNYQEKENSKTSPSQISPNRFQENSYPGPFWALYECFVVIHGRGFLCRGGWQ